MKKILAIIGARPQFIKHAPIEIAFKNIAELISIHTGQHYDHNMSQIFFDELGMSAPKYMLEVGSHSHGTQTGKMMIEIENIVLEEKPDAILVYGDTNSTLAGALVGSKLHIPIIHIEAGLRSFNKEMPEELNRILTDHVSAMLFVPTQNAIDNLHKEGITENIYLSGDVMKDMVNIVKAKGILEDSADKNQYYYATLHRPYNTDEKKRLAYILNTFNQLSYPVKFPAHPRTRHKMKAFGLDEADYPNVIFCEPFSYFDNMKQLFNARALITDSGGMQKEAYWMNKKCATIRTETEWVETLHDGWNTLMFEDLSNLGEVLETKSEYWKTDLYGTGNSSNEIIELIITKNT
jgi:UDP-GlcNAc3NAcA epimerase